MHNSTHSEQLLLTPCSLFLPRPRALTQVAPAQPDMRPHLLSHSGSTRPGGTTSTSGTAPGGRSSTTLAGAAAAAAAAEAEAAAASSGGGAHCPCLLLSFGGDGLMRVWLVGATGERWGW